LDAHYSPELRIQIILDNHSAHISKETNAYLETKMTKQVLRHLRVKSKEELKERLVLYLQEVNENPVPFRWKYGLEN
ncbi:transposase and inactivated derivative, partial [Paenibacillus popilliae ATCC 14706]